VSEEQKEILQLLADKSITVEEAERLLGALADGQRRREATDAPGSERKRGVQEVITSVRDTLSEIGPAIRDLVGDSTDDFGDQESGTSMPISPIPLPAGSRLIIKNDRYRGRSGGDLSIEGADVEQCEFLGGRLRNLRIHPDPRGATIRWSGGHLRLRVPANLGELTATTMGGDIEVDGLACPLAVKSMGGDLDLCGLSREFKAKTMGGAVTLILTREWAGDSSAVTMGGNINATVFEAMEATRVQAETLGGQIEIRDRLEAPPTHSTSGVHRTVIQIGNGNPSSHLKLKTMGGNITLRKVNDE